VDAVEQRIRTRSSGAARTQFACCYGTSDKLFGVEGMRVMLVGVEGMRVMLVCSAALFSA